MSLRQRFRALGRSAALIGVMVLSISGIYVGIFTPGEASAVGAALVIALAVATRSLTIAAFRSAVLDNVKTSAMLYMIVTGASVLSPFLAVTQMSAPVGTAMADLGLGAYDTSVMILLAYGRTGFCPSSINHVTSRAPPTAESQSGIGRSS